MLRIPGCVDAVQAARTGHSAGTCRTLHGVPLLLQPLPHVTLFLNEMEQKCFFNAIAGSSYLCVFVAASPSPSTSGAVPDSGVSWRVDISNAEGWEAKLCAATLTSDRLISLQHRFELSTTRFHPSSALIWNATNEARQFAKRCSTSVKRTSVSHLVNLAFFFQVGVSISPSLITETISIFITNFITGWMSGRETGRSTCMHNSPQVGICNEKTAYRCTHGFLHLFLA